MCQLPALSLKTVPPSSAAVLLPPPASLGLAFFLVVVVDILMHLFSPEGVNFLCGFRFQLYVPGCQHRYYGVSGLFLPIPEALWMVR